jgi:hypothetical protein
MVQIAFDNINTIERLTPPVNLSPPVLAGAAQQGSLLTCTTGIWSDDNAMVSYQWVRGSANIDGATTGMYTLTATDVNNNIYCIVSVTDLGGTGSQVSNKTILVAPNPLPLWYWLWAGWRIAGGLPKQKPASGIPNPVPQWAWDQLNVTKAKLGLT